MKKIFFKEIFLSLVFVLSSFFLLSSNVRADTELNSSQISSQISTYINSDFDYVLQNTSTYCTGDKNKYVIFIYNNDYYLMCQRDAYFQLYTSSNYLFYYINGGNRTFYKLVNGSLVYSSKPKDIIVLMSSSTDPLNMSSILYYSNEITSFYTPANNTYYFTYGSNTYYFKPSEPFPSLYSIYLDNSTPPDDTPVLTAFYTLIIDKLSVITDFFANNTYLFALPLIPIFILCIYLIKRSLIK